MPCIHVLRALQCPGRKPLLLLTLALSAVAWPGRAADLAAGFREPPQPARPAAYWLWLNGYVDHRQLTRELEDMKDKGIGLAQIFDIGTGNLSRLTDGGAVPAGPEFMGPESLRDIAHAIREAGRLKLDVGLITSSSWNAGGSWVPPEDGAMGLYVSKLELVGPQPFAGPLPLPKLPDKSPKDAAGRPLASRDVAVMAVPLPPQAAEAPPAERAPTPPKPADPKAAGAQPALVLPPIADLAAIVDLSDKLDAEGRLQWQVPPGRWAVLRFVGAATGQAVVLPSPNSHGLAIDHFRADTTRRHFQLFIDRLTRELGPLNQTALKYLYLCSYELRGAIWTPDFPQQFARRRGYELRPYLPLVLGGKLTDEQTQARFIEDYEQTLADLITEDFYAAARETCNRHGLLLCAEAGGPGPPLHNVPVDALRALGAVDILRGEFWNQYRLFVVKETAAAAHIYGRPVVDMEAFTSWRHWQEGPGDLKPVADRALCEGCNHFTFHTWPHQPPDAGQPGWAYSAGEHAGPSRAWWPKARPFVQYLARCSHLLQQGHFVADVCYFYGDRPFNFVPAKHVPAGLGPGYDYDVANPEVLLTRMAVRDGRIVLPDGMSYELLVLPDDGAMNPAVVQKLHELAKAGATIVGPPPTRARGLADRQRRDDAVRQTARELWGQCDGKDCRERAVGAGRVVWGIEPHELLARRGRGADFHFTSPREDTRLDWIHRRTPEADIYFVRNLDEHWEAVACEFRVTGRRPELWLPDSGEIRPQPVYTAAAEATRVPLRLAPHGSVFVVFRQPAEEDPVVSLAAGNVGPAPELITNARGELRLTAWRPGVYTAQTARGRRAEVRVADLPAPREIAGPWQVRFPPNWGAPPERTFAKLISWTDDEDEGVRYFSGIAAYQTEFDLPADWLKPGRRLMLDLGRVRMVADVRVNDQPLGILWKTPFAVDITPAVRAGKNRLAVEVANDWNNRLVGDARSAGGKRYCKTNIMRAVTQDGATAWKSQALQPSGLLGPVRVLCGEELRVEFAK